jgi:hypothetical protein
MVNASSGIAAKRQLPHPPETIAGTLAYMAREQTGRMNRSVDSRVAFKRLSRCFQEIFSGRVRRAPFAVA